MFVRRRQVTGDRILLRSAWSQSAVEHPADGYAVQAETVARVQQALAELPPEQQQVVRMRIYEDKTFAVIASELGIPLGTALGRMHTALAKLRKRLEDAR
jgi:RNA polymerase sigma-70 factor (ECF subfamily)